jgi:hypothetical protein
MRRLMTMALVILMAGSAFAQIENSMGIFFDPDSLTPANTNFNPEAGVEFEAYVCVLNTTVNFIGAYECGINIVGDGLFILGLAGPDAEWIDGEYVYPDGFSYGGTNFGGSFTNHLLGYQFPLPTGGVEAVLSKMRMLYTGTGTVEMFMGPSEPSSFGGEGPGLADGIDPTQLVLCTYTSGPNMGGLVATLNGAGIEFPVATESQSWSNVKSLFD